MSNIAARATTPTASAEQARGAGRGRRDWLRPSRTHLLVASVLVFASLPGLVVSGLAWSSVPPVAVAMFAAVLSMCLAWREKLRGSGMARTHTTMQADTHSIDLLDHVPGLITHHDAAGHVLLARGMDRQSFGLGNTPDRAAYLDAIHIGGRIAFLSAVDALRQGAEQAQAEFLFACASEDAGHRSVRARLTALRGDDGVLTGFVARTDAIEAEKALVQEAAHWRAEARKSNEAKTRFLAAVSHELRTPLNAILGFSDVLIGEYFGRFENDRQKEYVSLINQSGHHLLSVVTTMLDVSKIEAGRYDLVKEPFSIAEAIHTIDEMLGLQARAKGIVLTTRVARGIDEVVADRRAIQQILINLAGNAIKFTNEGGVVAIDASADPRNLTITVSDTGIGIPADRLAEIGMPFVQVENGLSRRYEGTGLGLALVKGLVALHGGVFSIESRECAGTVITVTVPMDGKGHADAETFEFPPRLVVQTTEMTPGEDRHGTAQAKIA